MANIQLMNDKVTSISVSFVNSTGGTVPEPAGDTFTVSSSSPSLGVSFNPTTLKLILTPKVLAGVGYMVTLTDSSGLPPLVSVFDIVSDPAAVVGMSLNTTLTSTVGQTLPTAPGP